MTGEITISGLCESLLLKFAIRNYVFILVLLYVAFVLDAAIK